MLKTILPFLVACAIMTFIGCKDNKGAAENAEKASNENAVSTTTCFLLVENKVDSTKVSLTIKGDDVKGEMAWLPSEKDGAIGRLSGKRFGDTLKTSYDYTIEGNVQQEEKWFLLKGDVLSSGEGELAPSKSGGLEYHDRKKIKFGAPFTKVDCK